MKWLDRTMYVAYCHSHSQVQCTTNSEIYTPNNKSTSVVPLQLLDIIIIMCIYVCPSHPRSQVRHMECMECQRHLGTSITKIPSSIRARTAPQSIFG
jgi:hypothetical protein